MSEAGIRVLVVDDDQAQLSLVERTLGAFGFEVTTCQSPIGVTNLVCQFEPHIVLMDVNIPALSGDQLLGLVRKRAPPGTLLVLYSASDEASLRSLSSKVGADGWISKSVVGAELVARLTALMRPPLSSRQ